MPNVLTNLEEDREEMSKRCLEILDDKDRWEKQFVEGMQDLYIRAMGVDPSSEEASAMRADLADLYQSLR